MELNPYQPTGEKSPPVSSKQPSRCTHAIGIASFAAGLIAFYAHSTIPPLHPAYGGAAMDRLIMILLGMVTICSALALTVTIHALFTRRWIRLVYAVPPAAYVTFLISRFYL